MTAPAAVPVQAETLRPVLEEELLDELLLEEDPPKRFKTICSLLLGLRLNVISCGLEPWLPTLRETCSPPPLAGLLMLIVICSGLVPPLPLPRLRIISGPGLEEAGAEGVGVAGSSGLTRWNVLSSELKACCALARSPDCKACPTAVKSCSRWFSLKGFPLAKGPLWPSVTMLL